MKAASHYVPFSAVKKKELNLNVLVAYCTNKCTSLASTVSAPSSKNTV